MSHSTKYKIPNVGQQINSAQFITTKPWFRYLEGIENLDGRMVTIEDLTAVFGPLILSMNTRLQTVEAEQSVQNNRLDGLEAEVFGGAGGSGEYGDGFGTGFAVS